MNLRAVFHLVAYTLMVLSLAILLCAGVSWVYADSHFVKQGMLASAAVTFLSGALLAILTRGRIDLSRRDGFGIVTFGWLGAAVLGSLPFLLCGVTPDFASALFETMSGFTTTGASVFSNLEDMPRGVMFWRCMTQWLGGMGVLVLCVAILPFLGVGGMQIYRAEISGPSKDRLTPRIATTAKLLWGVYLLLSAILCLLLHLGGMDWFDSLCHTFTTVSTGGFSTRSASVAAFDSLYLEVVITVFMMLCGVNFALHYRALRGQLGVFHRSPEFRCYMIFFLIGTLFIATNTTGETFTSFWGALRSASFQAASIMTTTGFATEDFARWPLASQLTLVLLMLAGGCAGSTAGGIKIIRIFILLKEVVKELRRFLQPNAVLTIKLGRKALDSEAVANIFAFLAIYAVLLSLGSVLISLFMPDLNSSVTSVVATLSNIGPGLGRVGPAETFAFVPAPGKLILTFLMLLGRLELYTVLALLLPSFWKK